MVVSYSFSFTLYALKLYNQSNAENSSVNETTEQEVYAFWTRNMNQFNNTKFVY